MLRLTPEIMEHYANRMRNSTNPIEARSLLMGINPGSEHPVILDSDLLMEHMHILGPTGSNKTSKGLIPLITNLIRNGETCIILDLKGDDALFHTTKLETERAGRKFKWFTNRTRHSTYVFNPFLQKHLDSMSVADVTGFIISALNMHHGDDYGRAYFTVMGRTLLQDALNRSVGVASVGANASIERKRRSINSFEDLFAAVDELAHTEEFRNARHLSYVIRNLAGIPQLNLASRETEEEEAVLKNQIHLPEVIAKKQVAYFYLTPAADPTSASEIARLAVYSTVNAAADHYASTGKRPRVLIICDEAQHLIAKNISTVLEQSRSLGVGMVLCHQTLSQLNPPGGVDLRELVLNCTVTKQFWAARDPATRDYISKISGEVRYYNASWQQLPERVQREEVGRCYAARSHMEEDYLIRIQEETGPRLTAQDIDNLGRDPNMCIMAIQRNHGYSCYDGAFPVASPWPMSKTEFDRRRHLPWPAKTKETMVVMPNWFSHANDQPDELDELDEAAKAGLFDELDAIETL